MATQPSSKQLKAGIVRLPDPNWPRAKRIRVEEYPHAWLVIGTSDMPLAAIELAAQVEEVESQAHALMFPRRPFHHDEHGSCVAFYFQVSGLRCGPKRRARVIREKRKEARLWLSRARGD